MRGDADAAELQRFGQLWQDRVRRVLVEHWDDPEGIPTFRAEPAGISRPARPTAACPDNASAQVANRKKGRSGMRRSRRRPSQTPTGTSGSSIADISRVSRLNRPIPVGSLARLIAVKKNTEVATKRSLGRPRDSR